MPLPSDTVLEISVHAEHDDHGQIANFVNLFRIAVSAFDGVYKIQLVEPDCKFSEDHIQTETKPAKETFNKEDNDVDEIGGLENSQDIVLDQHTVSQGSETALKNFAAARLETSIKRLTSEADYAHTKMQSATPMDLSVATNSSQVPANVIASPSPSGKVIGRVSGSRGLGQQFGTRRGRRGQRRGGHHGMTTHHVHNSSQVFMSTQRVPHAANKKTDEWRKWDNLVKTGIPHEANRKSVGGSTEVSVHDAQQYATDYWKEKAKQSRYKPCYGSDSIYEQNKATNSKSNNSRSLNFKLLPRPTSRALAIFAQTAAATANTTSAKNPTDSQTNAEFAEANKTLITTADLIGDTAALMGETRIAENKLGSAVQRRRSSSGSSAQSNGGASVGSDDSFFNTNNAVSGQGGGLARGGALFRPILTDYVRELLERKGEVSDNSRVV